MQTQSATVSPALSANLPPEEAAWLAKALAKYPCTRTSTGKIRTCPVKLSFPHVFVPQKSMDPSKPPRFSVTWLFPLGADISLLREAEKACLEEHYAADIAAKRRIPLHKSVIRDQGEKTFAGYEPGAMFFASTAAENSPPHVCDKAGQRITDPSRAYPGVWAFGIVSVFWRSVKENPGVSFGLEGVQIIRDGTPFSGRGDVSKDVTDVSFDDDTPDPFAGLN